MAPSGTPGRVLIAAGDDPLAPAPSWTRYDELANCRCSGWDVTTGRSSVFERTDVGTASVHFHDRGRVLDTDALVGKAIQLQIENPVTGEWHVTFRGVIDEPEAVVSPSGFQTGVDLNCVDMFAYLARVEVVPGFGSPPPDNVQQGATAYYASGSVQTRITEALTDATVPTELYIVFSGNVHVWGTFYDFGDSILNVIRDAADAEIPGIANVFVDRRGRIVFHGRYARFFPDEVAAEFGTDWEFTRWAAGDGAAIEADSSRAQVRAFSYSRPSSLIYNAAIAWPREEPWPAGSETIARPFPEKKKRDLIYTDGGSIGTYGYRAMPPMGDLIIKRHSNDGTTGEEQCALYSEFFVKNYKAPLKTIRNVAIKSLWPDDPRGPATWDLLTRIDISDVLNLSIDAGGVSNQDFFVEGYTKSLRVLNPEFDMVELTPNLTPAARYAENVFGPFPEGG